MAKSYAKKRKGWMGAIAFFLIVVIVALAIGWGSTGFTNWKVSTWFNSWGKETKEEVQELMQSDSNVILTETENHGISLMSEVVVDDDYAEYGIAAQTADTVYTLTVTYDPPNTTYQETDYTIAFKNPSSTWATGKVVTDYATITQSKDGSREAVLTVLRSFSEQIVVTAKCRRNPLIRATTLVDYVCAYANMWVTSTIASDIYMDYEIGSFDFSSGTILPDPENCVELVFTIGGNGFVSFMADKGYTVSATYSVFVSYYDGCVGDGIFTVEQVLLGFGGISRNSADYAGYWDALSEFILNGKLPENCFNDGWGTTESVILHRVYNGVDYGDVILDNGNDFELEDWSCFETAATGMTTDHSQIVTG